jgi:hypothetical protein
VNLDITHHAAEGAKVIRVSSRIAVVTSAAGIDPVVVLDRRGHWAILAAVTTVNPRDHKLLLSLTPTLPAEQDGLVARAQRPTPRRTLAARPILLELVLVRGLRGAGLDTDWLTLAD